jgi:hypothetical protein
VCYVSSVVCAVTAGMIQAGHMSLGHSGTGSFDQVRRRRQG